MNNIPPQIAVLSLSMIEATDNTGEFRLILRVCVVDQCVEAEFGCIGAEELGAKLITR